MYSVDSNSCMENLKTVVGPPFLGLSVVKTSM